ncbi:neurexin [Paragonimus westermani]|uniref:Neurexin n=1 Tax=Paragonimus westermani TaxID=34504 RepID=A0A5J4P1S6_9TREM|nr:neurexin [Paragonimus westermani]
MCEVTGASEHIINCSTSRYHVEQEELPQRITTVRKELRDTVNQSDALVLFNAGSFGVDFIAFDLKAARLRLLFDMGSGLQTFQLSDLPLNDSQWHTVEILRNDVSQNVLLSMMDKNQKTESASKIHVVHGDRSKNFDLADALFVGGIPDTVYLQWREKLEQRYGFQGCLANVSVNDRPAQDLIALSHQSQFTELSSKMKEQVVPGCFDRPLGATSCLGRIDVSNSGRDTQPHCYNGGFCLQQWTSVECACESTAFRGPQCEKPGTTLGFGRLEPENAGDFQSSPEKAAESKRLDSTGYLRITYTDRPRNTEVDEFVLGIQITPPKAEKSTKFMQNNLATLMFVTNTAVTGDYMHLYMISGFLHVYCDFGGGSVRITGPRVKLDDGFFHRVRGLRNRLRLSLQVDEHEILHDIPGRQMIDNPNQHVSSYRVHHFRNISGVYYNGLPLTDIAAGLTYRQFIHVTQYGNVRHMTKFNLRLAQNSSYHQSSPTRGSEDRERAATNNVTITNGEGKPRSDAQADAHSVNQESPSFSWTASQLTAYGNKTHAQTMVSFSPRPPPSRPSAGIYDQVNIWLITCLAGAGCIILVSVTFLAYRFHLKRKHACSCLQSSCRNDRKQPSTQFVHTYIKEDSLAADNLQTFKEAGTDLHYNSAPCGPRPISRVQSPINSLRSHYTNARCRPISPVMLASSPIGFAGHSVALAINPLLPNSDVVCCPLHSTLATPSILCLTQVTNNKVTTTITSTNLATFTTNNTISNIMYDEEFHCSDDKDVIQNSQLWERIDSSRCKSNYTALETFKSPFTGDNTARNSTIDLSRFKQCSVENAC